jgi:RNA polymerase sigma factor (sigma-70 family)
MHREAAVPDFPSHVAPAAPTSAVAAARFEAELRPLLPQALRLATAMLLDGAAAEDAVQEAALRAWQRRDNRREGTELGPWFLGIVANRCRETRRARWLHVVKLAQPPEPGQAAELPDLAAGLDVRRALRSLPSRARLALVLRFFLDLPLEEVAAVLGCSVEAARSRVRRAAHDVEAVLTASGGHGDD